MISLENIVRGALNSRLGGFLLAGTISLVMYACDGKATPAPVTTEPTRPAPTATFTPPATPTYEPPMPTAKLDPTAEATKAVPTSTPVATATPRATETPAATSTPVPNNSYDFAKSLGLEAVYLKDVVFDANSRGLVSYLASLPAQMRAIAERSGMLEDILADKKIDAKETVFFNKVIGSYQKEIETMKPWLSQLSENDVTAALALNLRNFRERGKEVPSLLSTAIFYADGIERKYEQEILFPEIFQRPDGRLTKPYATVAVRNITHFSDIRAKAMEVANNPNANYFGHSIEDLLSAGYFEGEAVGSTDKGQNAYEDMKLLLEHGSPQAKAALLLYARNLTGDGNKGSAGQARVELTGVDSWSLGIPSYEVILAGHDVPTIPLTLEDIALLKSRSSDPLLILELNGGYHMPLQWTRKSSVKKEWEGFVFHYGPRETGGVKELKVSELKNY